MTHPLITIAIPTYNNEKTIQKTIDSCLKQNTKIKYEILIVNNASTDNTGNIIESYKDNEKIRTITNAQTETLFVNHNICLEKAYGEYIIFCHSDDTLEEHAVETFFNKLEQRNFPKKYIVWGHSMFRDFSAKMIKNAGFTYNKIIVGEYAPLAFLYGGLTPSGTCFSRESFVELGGYIETTNNLAPSDMTTMLYLAMHGFRFEMIDEMVFKREFASNALNHGEDSYLEAVDDAYKHFLDKVNNPKSIQKLINLTYPQENKPFYFYYAIAQEKQYKNPIKRAVIKSILKNPWHLNNVTVRKLIKRLYS